MIHHQKTGTSTFMNSLLITALLLLATRIPPVYAHPHVFVDYGLTFVFNQQGLTGIALDWAFDEMFTQMLLEEGDMNHDQRFDAREIAKIKKMAFDNLAHHAWFTHILVNGRPYPVTETTGFHTALVDGRAHYSFFIPCRVAAGKIPQQVSLTLYDSTYYTDLSLISGQVDYRGPCGRFALHHEETLAQEAGFPQAPLLPDGIVLELRSK